MSERRLREIAGRIEARLEHLFEERADAAPSGIFSSTASPVILEQVRDLTLRAGKRFRAALVFCGAQLFDPEADGNPGVLDAAAAMELLHTYFLIHDDIMDEDETRRGGPSVHFALASRLKDEKLGRDLAILCGDLAVALQENLLARLEAPSPRRATAARVFSEMHLDVIHGQTLDLLGGADAEEVASRKTASYTTVGPLAIGAALGGATEEDLRSVAAIGLPLGVAFQLRDDLLGVFGESALTGKPVGTDLKKGKRTFLVQEVMARGSDDQIAAVRRALEDPSPSDLVLDEAIRALQASGARGVCQARVDELIDRARGAIEDADYLEEGKRFLLEIADLLGRRDR